MNNPKGFVNIVLIGAVVLLLTVGGYFAWSKKTDKADTTSSLPPATSQVDAPGWKTYTNTQYGFEFEYPNDRIFEEIKGTGGDGVDYFDVNIDTRENMEFTCDGCDGPAIFFKVSHYKPKSNLLQNCSSSSEPGYELSKVKVSGLLGDKCVSDGLNGPNLSIYLSKDRILYYHIRADNYSGEQKVLIDQILATFKFTK